MPDQTASPVSLRCLDLAFAYGAGPRVLDGVSLGVESGKLLVVAGPNGCGKSTLLSLLLGFARPLRGQVELEGRPLSQFAPVEVARIVAAVPQSEVPALALTGLEMALLGRTPHRQGFLPVLASQDIPAAERALERAGASAFAHRLLGTLSGGERQLVRIARALAQEPQILLLDEPSSSLDLAHQQNIFRLLRSLAHDEGLAVLTVSHDLNLAATYADQMALMAKGRVHSTGAPDEVMREGLLREVFGADLWTGVSPEGHATVGLRR